MATYTPADLAATLARNEQLADLNPTAVALAATPSTTPRRKRSYGKRADLGGQNYRSAMEANYARYLNLLVAAGALPCA